MPKKHEYEFLKKQFLEPDAKYRLIVYFDAKRTDAATDAANFVASCERQDIGGIIPRISDDRLLDPGELEHFRNTYRAMIEEAQKKGLQIIFNFEGAIEDAIIGAESDTYDESYMRSKVLIRREYYCSEEELVKMNVHDDCLMSIVAIGGRNYEVIDLREFVDDGELEWQAPEGNWVINEYLCVDDEERNFANVMNYDASMKYLEAAYSLFVDIFREYSSDVLSGIAYSNVCFSSRNRRDWDLSFNEVFEKRYGFDPAPYYPALFSSEMKDSDHLKALFFDCRASMLADGMIKALYDFATARGLQIMGSVSEPKLSACSFVSGDTLLDSKYAPGAVLDKAYMYGTNSIKIAAAASYNFGEDNVSCELFRDYYKISKQIMYDDVLNAYARGANLLTAHLPVLPDTEHTPIPFEKSETLPDWQNEFAVFTSRTQAMLRSGTHISDIGVLYPIYAIHSKVNLYNYPAPADFEYPNTHENLDYMTVINNITMYSGHDLTVIHPETLNSRCRVEDGKLYLDNGKRTECLQVMVLPCTETISIGNMRMLRDFFKSGGHIIATGELPKRAFEYDKTGTYDKEVRELAVEIFGEDAANSGIVKSYCYNKNENGGEAYFLYFSRTAADGTNMTSSHKLNDAIRSFEIPYDMYLPDMPRLEITGALNNPYYEFVRLGLIYSIPGGGMLNHIHKRHGKIDVYYFTNTTKKDYDSFVLLRGAISPEEWDPHAVTIKKLPCTYVRWRGEVYTRVELKLRHSASVFIISDTDKNPPELPSDIPEMTNIAGL